MAALFCILTFGKVSFLFVLFFGHSNWCVMISHHGFNLHFPTKNVENYFMGHLYMFGEVAI